VGKRRGQGKRGGLGKDLSIQKLWGQPLKNLFQEKENVPCQRTMAEETPQASTTTKIVKKTSIRTSRERATQNEGEEDE